MQGECIYIEAWWSCDEEPSGVPNFYKFGQHFPPIKVYAFAPPALSNTHDMHGLPIHKNHARRVLSRRPSPSNVRHSLHERVWSRRLAMMNECD